MALSAELQKAGFTPDKIATIAMVTIENHPQTSWTITKIHLVTSARIPGINADQLTEIANNAKTGCPISRLLKAEITLSAKLV